MASEMIPPDEAGATAPTSSSLIAVIIPVYNGADFVSEAIASALQQTYGANEVVVVDDGSTDATASVVNAAAQRDHRVRYVYQPNRNQAAARNTGLKNSSSALVAFLDADDHWEPEKLARQLEIMKRESVTGVFSDASHFPADASAAVPPDLFGRYRGVLSGPAFFRELYTRNAIPLSSVLVARSAVEEAGGFDDAPALQGCEDWELWLKLVGRGHRFYGMTDKLVAYRSHGEQTSRKDEQMLRATILLKERYLATAQQAHPEPALLARVLQRHRVKLLLLQKRFGDAIRESLRLANHREFGWRGFLAAGKQTLSTLQYRLLRLSL